MGAAISNLFRRGAHTPLQQLVVVEVQHEMDRLPVDATDQEMHNVAEMSARWVAQFVELYKAAPLVLGRVADMCFRLGIACPLGATEGEQIARACDKNWWLRAIRKEHARRFEHVAIQLGFTSYRAGIYLSNESAVRQRQRNADSAAVLARTELENEQGQTYTLEQLAALGTANKSIRRGELMTRIRGLEEIATDMRHVGLFVTVTAPSKFHAVLARSGEMNPSYGGASPRAAQAHLCGMWQCARAALHRRGIRVYGFRIAEPHHDGCPHWHMLLFVEPAHAATLEAIIRRYALEVDGDEPGAQQNRVKFVSIDPGKGTAAGYIAKYVAKNIDGAHVGDHKTQDGWNVVTDMLGNEEITPSQRVTLWSQLHGIRQFQPIGGPPIGVWRELRRVKPEAITRAPACVKEAWAAAQRVGDQLASFAGYVRAMGGATVARKDVTVCIAKRATITAGRYATYTDDKPCGVYAAAAPHAVYESIRYQWKRVEKGAAGAARSAPWTGVNNCTPSGKNAPWVVPKPAAPGFEKATFASVSIEEFARAWRERD